MINAYEGVLFRETRCLVIFSFKKGWVFTNSLAKKECFNVCVLKLPKDLFFSCFKVLVGIGTKDKPFVRTDNSSSIKVWLERL